MTIKGRITSLLKPKYEKLHYSLTSDEHNEGSGIMKCPDCGAEINTVVVERFQTQTFKVNHETQEITPTYSDDGHDDGWDLANDYAYHCPNCDSLNIDEMLSKYKLKV